MSYSFKVKRFFIAATLVLTSALSAFASENVISSVTISKSKDSVNGYELNIDSTQSVNYKTVIEDDGSVYFDLKNSVVASDLGTIYDDVVNIDNVVVKQLDKNKVRIYVQGKGAKNTELMFVNSIIETAPNPAKRVVINRPIMDYQPIHQSLDLEYQEENQEWDDNSFNFSHLGSIILLNLKDGIWGMVLVVLLLVAIFAVIIKNLTKKITQESEPLIGLNNQRYLDNTLRFNKKEQSPYQAPPVQKVMEDLPDVSQRNRTLKMAQAELTKAHQKYQDYLQNKYKGTYKPKSLDVDAVRKSIALNQYQRSTQNPYKNQEVIKINKEFSNNIPKKVDNSRDSFQIPPRPTLPKKEFSSPYIQRPSTKTEYIKRPQKPTNMKFLESVTKIYEDSGRKDLANGLKTSIAKTKTKL